jgi:hypothetical protein
MLGHGSWATKIIKGLPARLFFEHPHPAGAIREAIFIRQSRVVTGV